MSNFQQELSSLRSDIVKIKAKGLLPVVFLADQITSRNRRVQEFEVGTTIRQMAAGTTRPCICLLDGEPVLRADWDYPVTQDDRILFVELVEGGGDEGGSNPLRIILTIVLVIVLNVYGATYATALNGALGTSLTASQVVAIGIVAGSALINTLVPYDAAGGANSLNSSEAPSSVYNVALSSNQAKPNSPIPVLYGRHLTYPDFAAQPYTEYANNDQFYYALFCVGWGPFTINDYEMFIDDTRLDHFEEVTVVMSNLEDGNETALLALVKPNVVIAPEVSGQTMETSKNIGPFTICGSKFTVSTIGIDIVWPSGLGYAEDGGGIGSLTTQWRVYARAVDSFGVAVSGWAVIGDESFSANSVTPQRRTYNYAVASGRYEVRVARIDEINTNTRAAHTLLWASMRGFIDQPVPMQPGALFIALRIRASEQLNGNSQRRFALIARRQLVNLVPSGGGYVLGTTAVTRNPAWVLLDILRDDRYGGGLAASRIDYASIYELAVLADARGDRFDYVFDSRLTLWDALATVCSSIRCIRYMRGGVFTFARDTQQPFPVMLFNNRNINKGTLKLSYITPTEDTPDGIDVTFFNSTTWADDYFTVSNTTMLTGVEVEPENPEPATMPGVTRRDQIAREAYYRLATNLYRRRLISFSTESEGFLPSYGDLIAVSHDMPQWGKSRGEIVYFDGTSLIQTTEELDFTAPGIHYMVFLGVQGDFHGPYPAIPVDGQPYMCNIGGPLTGTIYTGVGKERTKYSFGPSDNLTQNVRVTSVVPRSMTEVDISGVIEDDRVHLAETRAPQNMLDDDPPGGGESSNGLLWEGIEFGYYQLAGGGNGRSGTHTINLTTAVATGAIFVNENSVIPVSAELLAASDRVYLGLVPRPEADPGWNRADYDSFWGDMQSIDCSDASPDWTYTLTTVRGGGDPLNMGWEWDMVAYTGTPPEISGIATRVSYTLGVMRINITLSGFVGDWWIPSGNGGGLVELVGMTAGSSYTFGPDAGLSKFIYVTSPAGEEAGTVRIKVMDALGRRPTLELPWTV